MTIKTSQTIWRSPELRIRTATLVVAAFNSAPWSKAQADYVCDGIDDQVEIQAAIDALPAGGGTVLLAEGTYNLGATVFRAIDNVTIRGQGKSTLLNLDGATALFSVGAQNAWTFTDLATDAGGIDRGTSTNTRFIRTWIGGVPHKDLETPPKLRLVQTAKVSVPTGIIRNIWMEGDFLYLALEQSKELLIFDIFNPTAGINLISRTALPSEPLHLIKRGNYIYATLFAPGYGVTIIDVSNPSSPVVTGTVGGSGLYCSHGAYLKGNHLYVANWHPGNNLSIVDVSDVSNPWVVSTLSDPRLDGAHDVTVDFPFAYVGTNFGGTGADGTATEGALTIVDVSNPENPTIISSLEAYEIQHLVKRGRYIFAATTFHGPATPSGLYAIDVINPASPTITSKITGFGAYWLHLAGDYIFVAATRGAGLGGLYIVDISDPTAMKVVSKYLEGTHLAHVFVYGKYVTTAEVLIQNALHLFEIEQGLNLPVLTAGGVNFPPTRVPTRTIRINHSDLFMDVLAASTNHIHPAITPDGLAHTDVTSPDVPRNVMIRITNTDTVNAQIPSGGNIVIEGVNARGSRTSETLVVPATSIPAGGTLDIFGSKAFATVSKIIYYSETNANITVSVGISDKLGLSNVIRAAGDVFKVKRGTADVPVGVVDIINGTVDCATIVSGDDFTIYYRSNLNILA